MRLIKPHIAALIIVSLGLFIWGRAINFDLSLDDAVHITENKIIQNKLGFSEIFKSATWPGSLYRPVTTSSIYLDALISGDSIKFMHLTNIALHILAALILYLVLQIYFSNSNSLIIALLFLAHPIHQEVVTNISTRNESLSAIFILLGIFFANSEFQRKSLQVASVSLLYSLAFLSKESSIVAVLLIPLMVWANNRPAIAVRTFFALGSATVILLAVRYSIVGVPRSSLEYTGFLDNIFIEKSFFERLPHAVSLLGEYIKQIVFPLKTFQDYSYPMISPLKLGDYTVSFYLLGILPLLLASFAVFSFKKNKKLFAFSTWFFIACALSCNIFIISVNHFALRYMYLSSIGILCLLVYFVSKINGNMIKVAVIISLLLYYSSQSFAELPKWQNDQMLRFAEISAGNNGYKSSFAFANDQLRAGNLDLALKYALRADQIYPNLKYNLILLQKIYILQKKYPQAKEILESLSAASPESEIVHDGLGWVHFYQGNFEESKVEFSKALTLNGNFISSKIGLISLAAENKDKNTADELLKQIPEKALRDPRLQNALKRLSN